MTMDQIDSIIQERGRREQASRSVGARADTRAPSKSLTGLESNESKSHILARLDASTRREQRGSSPQ